MFTYLTPALQSCRYPNALAETAFISFPTLARLGDDDVGDLPGIGLALGEISQGYYKIKTGRLTTSASQKGEVQVTSDAADHQRNKTQTSWDGR